MLILKKLAVLHLDFDSYYTPDQVVNTQKSVSAQLPVLS